MGKNPITTEGAKAVIKAVQTSKVSKLETIELEVSIVNKSCMNFVCSFEEWCTLSTHWNADSLLNYLFTKYIIEVLAIISDLVNKNNM